MARKKKKIKIKDGSFERHFADLSLLSSTTASNVNSKVDNAALTYENIKKMLDEFSKAFPVAIKPTQIFIHPSQRKWVDQLFGLWEEIKKFSPIELKANMELYKNIIETEYGVKLCVRDNIADFTSMEILVPNKLFADDKSREKLADALQKIAMFVLSMDDPNIET
jgi:hypothetical protein